MKALLLLPFLLTGASAQVVFPKPSGPHPVGTKAFHWTDESREETMTPEPGDKRELMVQLWYPIAKGAKGENSHYLPEFDELRAILSSDFRAHERKFKRARIPAVVDAPPLKKRLPVIVFSHGLGTCRLFYTGQLMELASHGYCVASLDHTYDVEGTVFPGPYLVRRLDAAGSDAEKAASLAASTKGTKPASPRLQVWAKDLSFVLDQLTVLNGPKSKSPFKGRIDLGRVGMLGHCYGAEAAMLACSRDKRFKACANQNGWPPATEVAENGLTQPFLFMWGELTGAVVALKEAGIDPKVLAGLQAEFAKMQTKVLQELNTTVYRVDVAGQEHMDFTDLPMVAEWIVNKSKDAVMATRQRFPTYSKYTLAFFDTYLKRRKAKLLRLPPDKHVGVAFATYGKGNRKRKR